MKIQTIVKTDYETYFGKIFSVTENEYRKHIEYIGSIFSSTTYYFRLETNDAFLFFSKKQLENAIIKVTVLEK